MDTLRPIWCDGGIGFLQERLDHAKSKAEKCEAENGRKQEGEGEAAEASPVFNTFLPRIQVASPRSMSEPLYAPACLVTPAAQTVLSCNKWVPHTDLFIS